MGAPVYKRVSLQMAKFTHGKALVPPQKLFASAQVRFHDKLHTAGRFVTQLPPAFAWPQSRSGLQSSRGNVICATGPATNQ